MSRVPSKALALASWARVTRPSAVQQVLESLTTRSNAISFALGRPDVWAFPRDEYRRAEASVWQEGCPHLQYQPPPSALRHQVAGLMSVRGVVCGEDEVFVTAGAQQALSLLARLLLDPGGCVAAEELSYPGFWQAIEPLRPEVLRIPARPGLGMDLDALEEALKRGSRPAFIYTVPSGHNPLGVDIPSATRLRLVCLAREFGIPIIEDDSYGFLRYDPAADAPLSALDRDWVIYVGTFSKVLAPALRVGWIVAPEHLVAKLAIAKEAADINTATASQHALSAYLATGHLSAHLPRLCELYRTRRDAMLDAVDEGFPQDVQVNRPASGFFMWLELPYPLESRDLWHDAWEREGVAVLPEHAFRVGGLPSGAGGGLRLSFSSHPPETIHEGMRRLARAARRLLRRSRAPVQR